MSGRFRQARRDEETVDSTSPRQADLAAEIERLELRCRITFGIVIVGCAMAGAAIIIAMLVRRNL